MIAESVVTTANPPDYLALYEQARRAREDRRLDEAVDLFRQTVAVRPEFSRAWHALGLIARERGARAEALEHFRAAFAREPGNIWIGHDLGHELREAGRLEEAEAVYRGLVETDPKFARGRQALGQLLRQRGLRAEALEHFRAALVSDPENIWIGHDLGHELREAGRLEEAEAVYRELVAKKADFSRGWQALGQMARQRGAREEALEHFSKAYAWEPGNVWVGHDLAHELREAGRLEEAEAVYRELVAKKADFSRAWQALGQMARQRGAREESLEHFRTAFVCEPGNVWIGRDFGQTLRECGRLDEAEEVFRGLIENNSEFSRARQALGQIARERGAREEALEHFRAAFVREPENIWIGHDLAHELRETGRIEEAEVVYRGLVEKKPDFSRAWQALGQIARQRGALDEALAAFRTAHAAEPDNVWVAQDIATTLRSLGRRGEAEAFIREFASTHQGSGGAWRVYADLRRGRAPEAEIRALYERAITVEPDSIPSRGALANHLLSNWRLDAATEHYDAILALDAANITALMGKGQIARRLGRRDVAREFFERAAARPGGSAHAEIELAREAYDAGRFEEADRILRASAARWPANGYIHMNLGVNARSRGNLDAAMEAYSKAAAVDSNIVQARLDHAICLLRKGRAQPAIDMAAGAALDFAGHAAPIETLALFAQHLNEFERAAEFRRRGLELDCSNVHAHLSYAYCLAKAGMRSEAAAVLANAEAVFGAGPDIALSRAGIAKEQGDLLQALALLDKARCQFSDHFELRVRYMLLLVERGALSEADAALADTPLPRPDAREQARIEFVRARLAMARWRPLEAESHFEAVLRFDPTDIGVLQTSARLALMRMELEMARSRLSASVLHNIGHRVGYRGQIKSGQTMHGQILDEFRLEPGLVRDVREAAGSHEPERRLAPLVRANPHHTAAALAFCYALRQAGRFGSQPTGPAPAQSPIPRAIVQYWDRDPPADIESYCRTWPEHNPDFRYQRFSLEQARIFLGGNNGPRVLRAFDRAVDQAKKADIFRLAYLFVRGGYYADADDRCQAPLDGLAQSSCDLILCQEDWGSIGNDFMAAAPRHPVIGAALSAAVDAVENGGSDLIWLSTGPGLLTRCAALYFAEETDSRLLSTRVFDTFALARFVACHCDAAYKHTQSYWLDAAEARTAKNRLQWPEWTQAAQGPQSAGTW